MKPATEWRSIIAHGETVGFQPHIAQAPERGERNTPTPVFFRPIRGFGIIPRHFSHGFTVGYYLSLLRSYGHHFRC
jgi:hypothetical protein